MSGWTSSDKDRQTWEGHLAQTKEPSQTNDVTTKAYVDGNFLSNAGDTATGDYNFDSNTLFIDSTNNRVGVGTITPTRKFQVVGNYSADATKPISLISSSVGNSIFLIDALSTGYAGEVGFGYGGTRYWHMGREASGKFTIVESNVAGRMTFLVGGKIGIGTTGADKQLEINSADGNNLRLTYNDNNGSAANYADLLVSSTGDLTINASGGDISLGDENLTTTGDVSAKDLLLSGVVKIDTVQVLKEQQAHIADVNAAYVAGELDTEAEIITAINATNAKINAILAMLETHGLVASS